LLTSVNNDGGNGSSWKGSDFCFSRCVRSVWTSKEHYNRATHESYDRV